MSRIRRHVKRAPFKSVSMMHDADPLLDIQRPVVYILMYIMSATLLQNINKAAGTIT